MRLEEFNVQMNRLVSQFGKPNYGRERVALIWKSVSDFSAEWFSKTVDNLLGGSRYAPLPSDFAPFILDERDRLWALQKKQNTQDAKDFWAGTLMPSESSHICKMIRKRAVGQVIDADWESFQRSLATLKADSS